MDQEAPVALVVGASRGIGRQVAISLAKNGYRVVVAAKTVSDAYGASPFPPNPNSSLSTINTVQREIKEAGGNSTTIQVDTRSMDSIKDMVDRTVHVYGRLDVVIYNSGSIWWASVENTPMKRFRLMQQVNVEGLYGTIQAAIPHFRSNGWKGRVVAVCPPIYSRFFKGKAAYAIGKVGMSVLTKGVAMDWKKEGKKDMAITGLWPAVGIQSSVTSETTPLSDLRHPIIFADAILEILRSPPEAVNGTLELDEDFLRKNGINEFSKYSVIPGSNPRRIMPVQLPDLTVAEEDDEGLQLDSIKLRESRL